MRLFEVIKIGSKKNIAEGISSVVYHFMGIRNAESVLKQNKFRLTASAGTSTEKALQKGDRMYYLSTTRHKLGGYHLDNSWSGVVFELDGSKLSQNYAGKAVDYWGAEWYGDPGSDRKGRARRKRPRIVSILTSHTLTTLTNTLSQYTYCTTKKGRSDLTNWQST